MKVTKDSVKFGVNRLIENLMSSLPSSRHKFGAGLLLGMKWNDSAVDAMLLHLCDSDGRIDTDDLRRVIETGFKYSEGKIELDLFNNLGILSTVLQPVKTTISKDDLMKVIDLIEHH